jgi:hypothetical protein
MTKTSVRVLTLITCVGALALIVDLTGCANDRHNLSTGRRNYDNRVADPGYNPITDQHIEDSRTAERVREALAAGAGYRYDGVKVIASNGVVQLSGFVNTSAQKNSAGEVARKVVDVKEVVNSITVNE